MRLLMLALLMAGVSTAYAENTDDDIITMLNEGDEITEVTESPNAVRQWVNCHSERYGTNRCFVHGRIRSVRLVRRFSFAPCIAGQTFGATARFVWVRNGCSGQFMVQTRR